MCKKIVEQFEEYNLNKLIQVLSLVDHCFVSITIGSLDDILEGTLDFEGKYFLSTFV